MESTRDLLKQKDALEQEIREAEQALRSHGVTRTEALVDKGGFPRSDIDVGSVVEIRRLLNCKQNDLKTLMAQIETSLAELHQREGKHTDTAEVRQRPFARVGRVVHNSPAFQAGLQVGDKVVRFGTANATNHDNMKKLISETVDNVNRQIEVAVERVIDGKPQVVALSLIPRRDWGEDSLLGCSILPLQ